jgi:hypothetical protein
MAFGSSKAQWVWVEWEYSAMEIDLRKWTTPDGTSANDFLRDHGHYHWELVSVTPMSMPDHAMFIFKRPKA